MEEWTEMPSKWESQPDPHKETRERVKAWLGKTLRNAGKWAAIESARLAKEGAKATASELDRAAKSFRKGEKDEGVDHLKKAAEEAHRERAPEAAAIEAKANTVQKDVTEEANEIMRGEK